MNTFTMTIDELAEHMHRDRQELSKTLKKHERRFRLGAEVDNLDTKVEDKVVSRKTIFTNRGIVMMMRLVDKDEEREGGPFTVLADCLDGKYANSDYSGH